MRERERERDTHRDHGIGRNKRINVVREASVRDICQERERETEREKKTERRKQMKRTKNKKINNP